MASRRGPFEGVSSVVLFNWPLYAGAIGVLVAASVAACFWPNGIVLFSAAIISIAALWFLVGSLIVTYFVYDLSDLHRFEWLRRASSGMYLSRIALCHCGFEDMSSAIRSRFPDTTVMILDHYDEVTMSEPSIKRARKLYPPDSSSQPTPFANWPVDSETIDVVLGPLAIHELRTESERSAWFREARRVLSENGRVVVMEHLRDLANFAAFGPGFVHFHSRYSWERAWMAAGLILREEFRVTPFLRVFVLQSKGELHS